MVDVERSMSSRRRAGKHESEMAKKARRLSSGGNGNALGAQQGGSIGDHFGDGREWYWRRLTQEITAQIYGSVMPRSMIWAILGTVTPS